MSDRIDLSPALAGTMLWLKAECERLHAALSAAEARSLALADALRTLVEEAKAHICSRGDCECATAKAVKVAESLLEQK